MQNDYLQQFEFLRIIHYDEFCDHFNFLFLTCNWVNFNEIQTNVYFEKIKVSIHWDKVCTFLNENVNIQRHYVFTNLCSLRFFNNLKHYNIQVRMVSISKCKYFTQEWRISDDQATKRWMSWNCWTQRIMANKFLQI